MMRQGAGLTTLQRLFDQLDYSQKLLGKIMIKLIQTNFTPGKVQRIIEDQPSEQFYNKNFGIYDAAVEEGFDTTTQRQVQFAQLMYLRESGIQIPSDVIIESATLQNKNDLIKSIQQQEQAAQQQQEAQSQMQLQEQEATMQLAKARASADIGLGIERASRVQENRMMAVERSAEAAQNMANAQKDEDQALLNKVKAIKELQEIDVRQLRDLVGIYQQLKAQEQSEIEDRKNEKKSLVDQLSLLQNNGINNKQPISEEPPVMGA